MRSRVERVHTDFAEEINKIWRQSKGEMSKIAITKQIAYELKQKRSKNPKYIVNYWPISDKKVKVY